MKLPVQNIYEGGHSVARNPRIQTMFRMIGLGDNIGSGFPTILHAWHEEKWRKPDLSQNEEMQQVELRLWMISIMPEECSEYLQRLFGSAYLHLSKEAQLILGTAYLEGEVTNSRLQSVLEIHPIEIGHILSDLVEKKMLINNRKGRWTKYYLNQEYQIQAEQMELSDLIFEDVVLKNKTDRIIYNYIRANGFITTRQILDITDITTTAGASAALGRLMKMNLVEKVRKGKSFIYQQKEY